MKKLLVILLLCILFTGCDDGNAVAPLKNASVEDTEYNSIVLVYMKAVKEKVERGDIFVSDNYLYFIPVGSEATYNCTNEYIGTPYGGIFNYAYVGVVKSGSTYSYFFVSKDSEGYGYNFNSLKQIDKYDGAYCYSGDILYTYDVLGSYYNQNGSDYVEMEISSIDVNSSMTSVLNFRNLTKARIYYSSICNS